jgi:hypothetical protein
MPDVTMENEKKKNFLDKLKECLKDPKQCWNRVKMYCGNILKKYWLLCRTLLIASAMLYAITPKLIVSDVGKNVIDFCASLRVNWFTWFVLIAISIQIAWMYTRRLGKDEYPTIRFWIGYITLFLNYIFYLRYNITGDKLGDIITSGVYYVDIVVFLIPLILARFEPRKDPVNGPKPPITLQEDIPAEKDVIKRNSTVNEINDGSITTLAKTIIGNSPKKSFSIAINGEWGSGKTTYLDILKKELEDRKGDIDLVIIRFQPWEWVGENDIFKAFFDELSKNLPEHNDQLIRDIEKYTQLILGKGDDSDVSEKVLQVFGLQPIPKTISAYRDAINTTITCYNKKIVVMIDEIDRLDGEEILKTLKLIRSVADFKNTYFITAFDYQFVLEAITSETINRPADYLNKFFQQTITIPSNKGDSIKELIKKTICDAITLEENEQKELEDILMSDTFHVEKNSHGSQSELLSKTIRNMRQLKILANNFAITYHLVKKECDIFSIFYLELLKIYDNNTYFLLVNTPEALKYSKSNNEHLLFDELFYKEKTGSKEIDGHSKMILERIFPKSTHTLTNKSVAYAYNFRKYLYCQSFEEIPHAEIGETFALPTDERIVIEREYYNSFRRISYERHICEAVWKTEDEEMLTKHLIVALSITRDSNNHFASKVIDTLFSRISFPLNTQENISFIESICSELFDTKTIHITTKTLLLSKQVNAIKGTVNYSNKLHNILKPRMQEFLDDTFTLYGNCFSVDVYEILENFFSRDLNFHMYGYEYAQTLKNSIRSYIINTKETYAPYIIRHYARQNMGMSLILDDLLLTVFDVFFLTDITQNDIDRFTEFINSIESNNELAAAPKKYLDKIIETIKNGQKVFYLENEADAEEIKQLINVRNKQPAEN